MIRQVVLEAITRELVYPNKYTLITSENVSVSDMLIPKPVGLVKITIAEAANLSQTDFAGLFSIDPYCKVQVRYFY